MEPLYYYLILVGIIVLVYIIYVWVRHIRRKKKNWYEVEDIRNFGKKGKRG